MAPSSRSRPLRSTLAACTMLLALTSGAVWTGPARAATKRTTTTRKAGTVASAVHTFKAEVWADNWFALYLGDTKIGEDSVPITTERSFNAETFTFKGSYPLQLRAVSKDYVQDETGLEYIGTSRQQVGDGGFIAQITDLTTGKVVAATDGTWKGYVVFAAPLNDCADSSTPQQTCVHRILPEPPNWKAPSFDDSTWVKATVYTEDQVGVKDGYLTINWAPSAELIWTGDLKVDNTILWRKTVAAPR